MALFAMGQTTIYTPWGSAVSVSTPQDDMTPYQRDQWDQAHSDYEDEGAQFHRTFYGDGTYPWPSSTSKFNCHGYAWFMYWETNPLSAPWNMDDSEAENYFDDPSFAECSEAEADILWINNGAHSALTTGDPDDLISKWATGPLATHGKGSLQSPWPPIAPNTVIYYKKCYEEYSGIYYTDNTLNECSAQFENSGTYNYVDLEIEYEVAIRFEGIFSTGTGSTLYFHPD